MAIYTLQSMVSRIAGSRRGITFQKSGVQFSIRRRTVPVQKRSSRQSQQKNNFDHVQKQWRSLSGVQQATFAAAAPSYPRTDSLGNVYTLEPSALQTSTNRNQFASGASDILAVGAPLPSLTITPTSNIIDTGTSSFTNDWVPTPIPAGYQYQIFVSKPSPLSIRSRSPKSEQLVFSGAGLSTGTGNIYTQLVAALGNLTQAVGQWVFVTLWIIDGNTGQKYVTAFTNVQIS
jgi:hypothetical protein